MLRCIELAELSVIEGDLPFGSLTTKGDKLSANQAKPLKDQATSLTTLR
jgi:hypothetical protein